MKTRIPDAFKKQFPRIKETEPFNPGAAVRPTQFYKMGKVRISFMPAHDNMPAVMTVSRPDRYPDWDEIVYARYKIAPEIGDFALILPPLNEYINYTDGHAKNTFTMEELLYRR